MRILSMTATFGKLNHETLTLQPGLNVIEAPNEWGKSTWCAFLLAMLYGIDTSARSRKDFIADKERYAPWSGAPMSGRMEICWNDRQITLERSTKGRIPFGKFRAYETATGVEVTELTAANCGQVLLGVEQSVFARSAFMSMKDMPVTQDEALRRRLNSLVTTGEESGDGDDLAQKLKDLKNRCRFNRSGLLPQAESQQAEISGKLAEVESLQQQIQATQARQQELKVYQEKLLNHKKALQYDMDRNFAGKLAVAQAQLEIARERVEALEDVCRSLPNPKMLELKRLQLQQLNEKKEALQMEIQLQPPAPRMPDAHPAFQGLSSENAQERARADRQEYERLLKANRKATPLLWILGLLIMAAGILLAVLGKTGGNADGALLAKEAGMAILGMVLTVLGVVFQLNRKRKNKLLETETMKLARKYAPIQPDQWVAEAKAYADAREDYETQLNDYSNRLQQLDMRLKAILSQLETMTGGKSAERYSQEVETALQQHSAYADAVRERSRMEEMVATLGSSRMEALPPDYPDDLTFDRDQTERLLSDVALQQRQLHQKLGQCQGRMEALGDPQALRRELQQLNQRIRELEKVYHATVLAQRTLEITRQELQRRFAPRISKRAKELFAAMTGGRYQQLSLGEDLSLCAATESEDTLRSSLWRSDGTADQLYLALRLAVAEEVIPHAPLVLDDAFVRFDDDRLKETLKLLKQSGEHRQVLLFTCQSREQKIMEELS